MVIPHQDVIIQRILGSVPGVEGVMVVGSRAFTELVDSHSDIDLLVFVEGSGVHEYMYERFTANGVKAHWSIISKDSWKNLATPQPVTPIQSKLCFLSHTIDSKQWLYTTDNIEQFMHEYTSNIDFYRKQASYNFIISLEQRVLRIIREGVSPDTHSKMIHHLIRCGYILQDKEHCIDWSQLLRLKRISGQDLTLTDKEYIHRHMVEIMSACDRWEFNF